MPDGVGAWAVHGAGSIALALTVFTAGQDAQAAGGAAEANAGDSAQLHEVVVTGERIDNAYTLPDATTGTKTDTPLMETPFAVEVVPQQVLRDQFSLSLEQALTNVSGVYSGGEEPGQEYFTIRGFTTTATMWNGFRIDEYSTGGGGTVGAVVMDNVEKLEVLKGPASILYGRMEPGGMVNVITKQPRDQFYGSAMLSLGSWRDEWAGIDVTGPLNAEKSLLYRLNASEEHSDSWLWGGSLRSLILAPVLEWRVSPTTRITLEGQFRHDATTGGGSAVPIDPNTGQTASTPMAYTPNVGIGTVDLSRFYLHLTHEFDANWSASVKLLNTLSVLPQGLNSYISTAYLPPNFPAGGAGGVTIDRNYIAGLSQNKTQAAMVDFVGHFQALGAKHTLLFGGDIYHTPIDQNILGYSCCYTTSYLGATPAPPNAPFVASGPNGYQFAFDQVQSSVDYGVYLQDQVDLPGDLHLLVGERYQHYLETSASNSGPGTPYVEFIGVVDHSFTPRIGLLWRARPWLSLYYSFAENFGNNTGFSFPNTPLKPETSKQGEIGAKTEFFGGRLTSSLALYDLTKFNIASGDPNHQGFDIDIGEVRSKGVEYDLQGELAHDWNVILNFSYTQPYVLIGASGASSGAASISSESITAGERLPGVPEHLFNLWTTYRLPQPDLRGVRIGGGANWAASSSFPGTPVSTPAYWLGSLFGAWDGQIGTTHMTVQLNVNNVFNRVYTTNPYLVLGSNYIDLNYGNPRQVKLSARVEF